MRVPVSDARNKLSELVRRAEAGEEVVLTRYGRATVALVPVRPRRDPEARRALIASIRAAASGKGAAGTSAARSQDFLYGDSGLSE